MENDKITVCHIRHGITKGNLEGRYIGTTDEPLYDNKIQKAYPDADPVVSSPLTRCVSTARLIYPDNNIEIIEDFRETDFGRFEGKNYRELSVEPYYQKWIDSNGTLPFPDGESRECFIKRTNNAFDELVKTSFNRRKRYITAVVHGGTIMAVLERNFGGDFYDYHIKNLEGYRFEVEGVYCNGQKNSYLYKNLRRI